MADDPELPASPPAAPPQLILASRSPQRRAIREQLGIAVEVLEVDVEEAGAGDPIEVARTNALRKAQAGAAKRPRETILGVDTIVALDGEIFGKPASAQAARHTLKRLSGRTHEVVSGLALLTSTNPQVAHDVTKVTFRTLDDDLVRRYVETGEWSGRAGGYAIQGIGAGLVRRIMGDYLNVVGLPVGKLLDLDLTLMLRGN
ncbi:MAG: nucleoside triphosphate pyrophosphatase [Solirubrobacteraceae bacterium]|nr:nucleoside triphosphate pyrophosphatase [Solirubrobacteraceae bacterium]